MNDRPGYPLPRPDARPRSGRPSGPKYAAAILYAALSAGSAACRAGPLDDLRTWYGTGPNRAGFEIDWNDGTIGHAMAFGYRWNATATGEQMLDAVVAADPRLYAEVSRPTAAGTEVFGFGYDAVDDVPYALSPALPFDAAHRAYTTEAGVVDGRAVTSPLDHWQEGWFTAGYWAYWASTAARLSVNSADWGYAAGGVSSRTLADGDWDGWAFQRAFAPSEPGVPSAAPPPIVPEPAGVTACGLAGVCLARRRRPGVPPTDGGRHGRH